MPKALHSNDAGGLTGVYAQGLKVRLQHGLDQAVAESARASHAAPRGCADGRCTARRLRMTGPEETT
eukprot:7657865-Alexandrium_andersonii.AAC.1